MCSPCSLGSGHEVVLVGSLAQQYKPFRWVFAAQLLSLTQQHLLVLQDLSRHRLIVLARTGDALRQGRFTKRSLMDLRDFQALL
mmetsp:Transcript_30841/g.49524  ORF Transcript_30841/g.49524 Transcript_30841/m.49524 type:complete len:84 (+) Transcript_30841:299-550(+)